jgi:hypothetical protein
VCCGVFIGLLLLYGCTNGGSLDEARAGIQELRGIFCLPRAEPTLVVHVMAGGMVGPPAACLLRPKMSVTGGTEHLRRQHVVPLDTVLKNLVVFKRLVMFKF